MFEATAELSPWIRLNRTSRTEFENEEPRVVVARGLTSRTPETAPLSFGFAERGDSPSLPGVQWLSVVQQKIAASTIPAGYEPEDASTWLSQQVAAAALMFLTRSSSEFASAPYIYGSPSGELIAEFEEGEARTTFIISSDSVTGFALFQGKPVLKSRPIKEWSLNQLKFWREKMLASSPRKQNGALGS